MSIEDFIKETIKQIDAEEIHFKIHVDEFGWVRTEPTGNEISFTILTFKEESK